MCEKKIGIEFIATMVAPYGYEIKEETSYDEIKEMLDDVENTIIDFAGVGVDEFFVECVAALETAYRILTDLVIDEMEVS